MKPRTTQREQPSGINRYISIPVDDTLLLADLQIPEKVTCLVIFAYEFGGSRNHPRTRHVARIMREHGLGTLLCDLLTDEEEFADEATGIYRNNVSLLTRRLIAVTKWVSGQPDLKEMDLAYFGAGTGGGAVLIAASKLGAAVKAVVSRGGRVDLASSWLPQVSSPTLMIVGEEDPRDVVLGQQAFDKLNCEKELHVIPGASHKFGEPGKLESMAAQSANWLKCHLERPRDHL